MLFKENLEPTEKLFVGGLPVNFSEEELAEYFSQYGTVVEALVKVMPAENDFSNCNDSDKRGTQLWLRHFCLNRRSGRRSCSQNSQDRRPGRRSQACYC